MVKRVLTSIITLAVLMGALVACANSNSSLIEIDPEETPTISKSETTSDVSESSVEAAEPEPTPIPQLGECEYIVRNRITVPRLSEVSVYPEVAEPGELVTLQFRVQDEVGFFIATDQCGVHDLEVDDGVQTLFITNKDWSCVEIDERTNDPIPEKDSIRNPCTQGISELYPIQRVSGDRFDGTYTQSMIFPDSTLNGTRYEIWMLIHNAGGRFHSCGIPFSFQKNGGDGGCHDYGISSPSFLVLNPKCRYASLGYCQS